MPDHVTTDTQIQSTKPIKSDTPTWATLLDPISNLHQVDTHLFRSEQLKADKAVIFSKYGIEAVINLRFFDRNDDLTYFANHKEIEFINLPMTTFYVTTKRLASILWHITTLQEQGKTVLVHCYHGSDRTGIVIAMYRIIVQGWSVAHAKAEMISENFGYHTIWRNLENMVNQEEADEIKQLYLDMKQNMVEVVAKNNT